MSDDENPDVLLEPRELSWLMGWFHDQDAETERNGMRLFGHIAALEEQAAADAELVALALAVERAKRVRYAAPLGHGDSAACNAHIAAILHLAAILARDAAVQARLDAERDS